MQEVMDDSDFWSSKITYWDSVYDFDMTAVKHLNLLEPVVEIVPPESIASDTCEVKVRRRHRSIGASIEG